MPVAGFDVINELSVNDWHVLCRARRRHDHAPVLLKLPRRDPPRALDVALLWHELEILHQLTDPGVLRVRELVRGDGLPALVLEDPGGVPLQSLSGTGPLDLGSFLDVAIRLVGILFNLHRRDFIHRGISPLSVLVDPATREIWLSDFSRMSRSSGDTLGPIPVRLQPVALPYMSPEQTGRMNRVVDYRTDFYSLGITLYEMLTGAPPFRSDDPLELVHSHIARVPPSPSGIDPRIPGPLSNLIMKLLAKTAEDRYQSAAGLLEDLEIFARAWKATSQVPAFVLGQHDVPDRFVVSQRLYGRERDVEALVEAFDRCCGGPTRMVLVAGYSGIGKTALIRELYAPIVRERAYFISGKFDQVATNVPYGALIQALRDLFQQLCTESDDQLAGWRARLGEALGTNGGVIAEVIPEIELILGKQMPPPPLGPTEARNRFRMVFQNFLAALAQREHPLVVFLDDLQWADAATLDLMEPLLTGLEMQSVFLIGAYRDNEVDASHPLARTLDGLGANKARLAGITLGPLSLADLTLLLRDTLYAELTDVEPLARLTPRTTDGNPFFVIQFLKTLHQDGLLDFDYDERRWTYRLERIRDAAITDNVVDLMTRKIRRLPPESQRVLTLAACIGSRFDLATLSTVSELPVEATAATLRLAVEEGLVVVADRSSELAADRGPTSASSPGSVYGFLHDRVQQAAYALIPDDQKKLIHLTVGRLLLAACGPDVPESRLFEVVNHLNTGSSLISDATERLAVARLNLAAGRKAKTSTAYDTASAYLDLGIGLLSDDHWDSNYELMFSLHREAAECHYLARRFDVAEGHFEQLLARALTTLDTAQVHALRIVLYENLSHYDQAVSSGRKGLALFDVVLPQHEEEARAALDAEIDAIHRLLGQRTIASLVDLPVMTDDSVKMVMRILTSLWSPAYISGTQVIARLISATMVHLSLAHGNTEDSAYGYVTHAITIGPMRGDYRSAYEWGELALKVNERFDDGKRRAKIHQQFHAHVKLWRRPFETCIPHAREARRSGLEFGDLNYAGYGAVTETWPALPIANDLGSFVREYEPAASLLEKLKLSDFLTALRVMLSWALALQGRTASRLSLSNARFDEDAFVSKFEHEPFFRTFFDTAKLHLAVLLEEVQPALEAARLARQGTLAGTIWPVLADFWGGLALAGAFTTAASDDRARYWNELGASQRSLGLLADNCPENYRCFYLLLSAEMKRISSEYEEAERLCKEAIAYARVTDNLQQEALANELCARSLLARSSPSAATFLIEAHRCYAGWGSSVKVQQMEEKYGQLLAARPSLPAAEHLPPLESEFGLQEGPLDVSTVLKAARAIAVEIQLKDLLPTLMTIALENAGADRGFFLRDADGRLMVEAEGAVEGTSVLRCVALEEFSGLSRSIVLYVRRTGQTLVLGDARRDERFTLDPYVASAQPRSILCMPAIHQGKVAGLLYLENTLATDAFTADRVRVLEILCSQAAISLENARLYENVRLEATERRRAEEMLREVTEGTASATGAQFFRSLVRHLASALQVRYAFVTECRDRTKARVRSLAFWKGDEFGEDFEYDVADTPCRGVLEGDVCYFANDVQRIFPNDLDLVQLRAESYLGAPLVDAENRVIGHLAVLDDEPMDEDPRAMSILKIFSARAGAELERLHAERDLRAALAEVESLKNKLQDENVYLQEEIRREHNFDEIVGSSPVLLDALRRIERVAPTDATVLIDGETGTGKELVARAIHSRSPRQSRPLVKVNCGAISAGLVESELFGHVKGAFTGAIDKRVGRFELANGGTLFLDEVSELPLETQVKLLRVLQEQEFEPVGSSRTIRVNVRIIAATNRDLEEVVRTGRFRSDLFFRLNVLPLSVPPLRERRSDIPQLVTFFLSRFAKQFGKTIHSVARETMDLLVSYAWPGNVRELENVIERAVVLSSGPVLRLDRDLLPAANPSVSLGALQPDEAPSPVGAANAKPATLEEIERRHILTVLERSGGVIDGPRGAARILNLHPNTLRSRMKRLGLRRLTPRTS